MEVTMYHPDNKDGKVVVTNQIQYDAFKARGFVDAKENDKKAVEAAQEPALDPSPTATKGANAASNVADEPQQTPKGTEHGDADKKTKTSGSDKK